DLVALYGPGKRQTVARWINMAKAPFSSDDAIMGFLREKPYWPHGYVCGNPHFDGSDASARLNGDYMMAALKLLEEALAKSKAVNVSSFIGEYCKPMLIAQLWEKGTLAKFGNNVGKLPIFARVMRHLKTEGGRQEILACAKSATPLHGKNGAEGVKECSQLVAELQKLRDAATAAATTASGTPATAASHTPMSGTTGGEADTTADADMGMLVMEDADDAAKDPIAQRASQLALAELGGIDIVHNDFDAFLVQLQETIGTNEKLIFVLDAVTSKATILLAGLKRLKQAVNQLPGGASERWVAVIPVGRRFDVLSCLHEALITEFKENGTFCVQCTGGDVQSSRQLPTFVLVSQAKLCKGEKVPCSYSMNSVRAKAWEGLRQRCLDEHCPLRDSGKPLELDVALDEQEQGGDCIDIQEDDEEPDAGTTPSKGTQPQDPDSVPDALKKELYPFTRPVEQGLGLEMLEAEQRHLAWNPKHNYCLQPQLFLLYLLQRQKAADWHLPCCHSEPRHHSHPHCSPRATRGGENATFAGARFLRFHQDS
ncbi:unnamed protein product, partial [Symbiodinium necroappetens]